MRIARLHASNGFGILGMSFIPAVSLAREEPFDLRFGEIARCDQGGVTVNKYSAQ